MVLEMRLTLYPVYWPVHKFQCKSGAFHVAEVLLPPQAYWKAQIDPCSLLRGNLLPGAGVYFLPGHQETPALNIPCPPELCMPTTWVPFLFDIKLLSPHLDSNHS